MKRAPIEYRIRFNIRINVWMCEIDTVLIDTNKKTDTFRIHQKTEIFDTGSLPEFWIILMEYQFYV